MLILGSGLLVMMVLYDLRGLLFPEVASAAMAGAAQNAGWVLPEAITVELMGRPELRFELARDLRRRAIQMRRFSLVALAGIGVLLVVAVAVILFAGFIANLGVGATGPERIQQLLDAENGAIRRLREQESQLRRDLEQSEIAYFTAARPTRAIVRKLEDLNLTQADRERFQQTPTYLQAHAELESMAAQIASHQQALEAIRGARIEYLTDNIKSDFGASEETSNVNLLIASGITRFGILFIMLFIVQILVNLYRYSMRMSAYYLSQADALLLAEDGGDALLKVVPALSPQNVDFGKAPQTPMQNLEKLAEIAAKLR
ncbi:MAG: hypothetical protein H6844_03430 [Alphaproteobacteria bacterium]|nr:hypothetical protein [Alphaproteobacteria bacterium]